MPELGDLLTGMVDWGRLRVIVDVADVLVVAYLFYRLTLLVKGTRAMQMAIGLGLVFLVYHLARRLGLVTLYTILDALLTYIVLLIVVIFQNDIRRVLARVGQRPWFRGARNVREVQAIEEVVKAAVHMGQRHIGAIIVFERDAALDEFVEHGTPIDSAVTKEILYSLFVPHADNPLHDGAVIIREGRIWQAGGHLPLSSSAKLDRSLGTRHRAAIGISEETDAVVVVVSEERGSISLCFNGNMARGLDAGSLRQALLGLFSTPVRKKTRTDATASTRRASPSQGERPSLAPPSVPSVPAATARKEESAP
ncbi:diadenylate cyclase CdaA [Sandaracinus amylolyticus]|uniref:diadenylate cyclase CdaA n=1 Tax=Sandaracinus amylolyticus TaxID=927083 RepID=UPI001F01F74B|nr:diadenylate cyclase CdaA [Sandaracinus amylolyticus]UJR79796.1 Diadenylate cyclase [Sandaracinus amylolyticus]